MTLAVHRKKKFNLKITCYGCEETGHIRTNCPNGKKNSRKLWKRKGKGQTQAHVAKSDSDEEDYAFCIADVVLTSFSRISWLGDSGATRHIVKNRLYFSDYIETTGHEVISIGKSKGLGKGIVKIKMVERGKTTSVTLKDYIHCPKAPFNLISLGCITDAGFELKFKESWMDIILPLSCLQHV
ncbi:uncharacterized protein ARMOST_07708 [Armillaria ostoyae]|uniref:CCHC-type domain-containing protein n=1 Tax=Armillaria ostoyae TaxID=47428 RepID=A0A284R6L4_ARMOS|nr:uncharacterized protein ARMOST_07708 [Armillaria ostoyae]